jgi:hypothetical protein
MSYRHRLPDLPIAEAIRRSEDPAFFSHYFCERKLHSGQEEWLNSSEATINVLTTGNRYGKTSTLSIKHLQRCVLKKGAEPRYVFDGEIDVRAFYGEKYKTIHTAGLWDTAKLVWEDALQMNSDSERLRQLIEQPPPRTLPPEIRFFNGSRWLFRTLGDHGENIDGSSFYYISVDEAGWIRNLEEIMGNVLEVRVGDVRGIIDLVGTMKPGLSRDFYAFARRAAIATGKKINFDHRDGRKYTEEFPSDTAA